VPRAQHVDKDHARPSGTIDNVTVMQRKPQHFPFFVFVLITAIIMVQFTYFYTVKSSLFMQLFFYPSPFTTVVDTNFTVYIQTMNAPPFGAISLNVAYDGTMLAPYDVQLLVPWEGGCTINPNATRIKLDGWTWSNILEGNQTLAKIDITGIGRGNTTLFWDGTEVRDPDWGFVTHETVNGTIEIIGNIDLTVATDQSTYYLGSNATIHGNLTIDNLPESALVGMELYTQEGTKLVRSTTSGYIPPATPWLIEVLDFYTSNEQGDPQEVFMSGYPAYVTVEVSSHSNETLPMTLVVNEFDKYNSPFGIAIRQSTILAQAYNETSILMLPLSSQTPNGTVTVYLNILSDWPRNGGYPYCPEQSTTFQFVGGSTSTPPSFPPSNQTFADNYNLTFKLPNLNGLAKWEVHATALCKSQQLHAQSEFTAANLFVDDDGPADYNTIQAAINAATTRSTIYVYNGTYPENIIVNRTVYLVGESNASTIINGKSLGTVVDITQGGVKLLNFKITNSSATQGHNKGIGVGGIVCTLTGNILTKTSIGIEVNGFNDTSISKNTIYDNTYGILLHDAGWTTMSGNFIANNSNGLYLNGTLCGNTTFTQGIISNNTVGVQFSNVTYSEISETAITYNTFGVQFTETTYSTLSRSNISYNTQGGIMLTGSSCYNNSITGNNVSLNSIGIYLSLSKQNSIIKNDVMYNENSNLWVLGSSDNTIYDNNFIGESQAFVSASSNFFDNGYPQGGNYWSDYTGTDLCSGPTQDQTGSDGIGDVPYEVGTLSGDFDHYPLMKPTFEKDIAVTDVFSSKDLVAMNYTTRIYVRIVNYGSSKQSFNVTAYYNGTTLNSTTIFNMSGRSFTTVTLLWRPMGLWHDNHTHWIDLGSYTINASISELPDEVNTTNNYCTDGTISICVFAGDLTNDGKVGPADFAIFARSYGSTPSKPLWWPDADFLEDGKIGPGDFAVFSKNYGKTT